MGGDSNGNSFFGTGGFLAPRGRPQGTFPAAGAAVRHPRVPGRLAPAVLGECQTGASNSQSVTGVPDPVGQRWGDPQPWTPGKPIW